MIALSVRAIGLLAPGLAGWEASLPVLRGEKPYCATELPLLKPALLPAGERRRATAVCRLALAAAEEALAAVPSVARGLQSVFASSSGDMEIIDRICRALQEAERPISPTHFHNSVHNAPAGYWAIASQGMRGSTSLSGFDGSFGAGLLETAGIIAGECASVLLVAYDAPPPHPLTAKRPISAAFAVALLCAPVTSEGGVARLDVGPASNARGIEPSDMDLDVLRLTNPAARSLPLLQAIARGGQTTVNLPGGWPNGLQVEVSR